MEDLQIPQWYSSVAGVGCIGGPPKAIVWNQHLNDKGDEAYVQANENITALRGSLGSS